MSHVVLTAFVVCSDEEFATLSERSDLKHLQSFYTRAATKGVTPSTREVSFGASTRLRQSAGAHNNPPVHGTTSARGVGTLPTMPEDEQSAGAEGSVRSSTSSPTAAPRVGESGVSPTNSDAAGLSTQAPNWHHWHPGMTPLEASLSREVHMLHEKIAAMEAETASARGRDRTGSRSSDGGDEPASRPPAELDMSGATYATAPGTMSHTGSFFRRASQLYTGGTRTPQLALRRASSRPGGDATGVESPALGRSRSHSQPVAPSRPQLRSEASGHSMLSAATNVDDPSALDQQLSGNTVVPTVSAGSGGRATLAAPPPPAP